MAIKTRVYTFAISTVAAEKLFVGFLDMMRYDRPRVLSWTYDVILLTSPTPPTDGRWASFGLHVLAQDWGDAPNPDIAVEARERLPITR